MKTQQEHTTVLIIGGGIAGLLASIKIASQEIPVILVTKEQLGESNSRYAQGGIAAVLPLNKQDSIELHIQDTLKAGAGLSDYTVTKEITSKGCELIDTLIEYGVHFDTNNHNEIDLTLEAAHSTRRILHSGGDATGKNIENVLSNLVKENQYITVYENYQAIKLIQKEDRSIIGAICMDSTNQTVILIESCYTILATGGLGQIYQNTTNPLIATGDGISIAYQAGASIQDMEFIQFHPTALDIDINPRFLISEVIRGEGGVLINNRGEYFAKNYHPLGELAPRDVVTRSIYREIIKTEDTIYIDTKNINRNLLEARFPTIKSACFNYNIDITKDLIPVIPAAHYTMGGIQVNTNGQTSLQNLFAIGEVSCTSLHGANRLASNSLLECVVLAKNVADTILKTFHTTKPQTHTHAHQSIFNVYQNLYQTLNPLFSSSIEIEIADILTELKQTMWQNASIIRSHEKLTLASTTIHRLKNNYEKVKLSSISRQCYELGHMLTLADLIVQSAQQRKESRGAHYREDYPETLEQAIHSYSRKMNNQTYEQTTSRIYT